MTEHNFEQLRRAMVTGQLRTTAVNDPRVVAAMGSVAREAFVPPEKTVLAYLDQPVSLGNGRAMPAPMVTGRLITEARVRSVDRVLVVGAGLGYAAAVVARLAQRVIALDEAGMVAGPALPPNVTRVQGPLAAGWAAGAPYDLILIDGAVEQVPDAMLAQLADDGRVATGLVQSGFTRLAIGRKAAGSFGIVSFVDIAVPVLPGFARPTGFRF